MPNLDQEIMEWRRAMVAGGVADSAVLDELESHLRDHIEQQVRSGCDMGEAFRAGVERIGQPGVLKREFLRADRILSVRRLAAFLDDRRKCRWLAFGLAVIVAVGFYAWNARITPIYASVATAELQMARLASVESRLPVPLNDIRAAEVLNTAIRLLVSNRVRAKVAGTITPAERMMLFRPAVMRRGLPGASSRYVGNWLGTLSVRPMRLTFMVAISVTHEDAEAAALIANRYVQQWQAELASSANFQGVSVRAVDVATASRDPVVPNLKRILTVSIALGVLTFAGLAAVAALLRKLVRVYPDAGPQLKIE